MTTRKQAIQWWNTLSEQDKWNLTINMLKGWETLTGSEIENIFRKENKTETNIYLNRLKEQYKKYKQEEFESTYFKTLANRYKHQYDAMRLFCLDTELISFNDIELMEDEVNQSF